MLIDTREPSPERPVWEPDWRVWGRALAAVALGFAAIETAGFASVLLLFAAIYLGCRAIDLALPYHGGLTEWRQ